MFCAPVVVIVVVVVGAGVVDLLIAVCPDSVLERRG